MSRPLRSLACTTALAVVIPLSASLGACIQTEGSQCVTSEDCGEGLICAYGDVKASSGVCIEPDEDHGAEPPPNGGGGLGLRVNKDVDILFVIDNSGSMGEEQAILANNFAGFISVLESVDANYRVGITTTDNGNPWCPPGQTTPEGGKLVLSSCKERLGDFLFNNGQVDVQDLACNDLCTLSPAELEILPSVTDVDANPVPRPWLENIEGQKNIPDWTDPAEAFKCFGPQGINGCGFESQLESMYLSLIRAQDSNEASYGFLRANAILAVVIVTDEADCSYNKDWAEIFDADGTKVFWSDPNAAFPTSAVCWNAGVECFGDPNNYDSCEPVNKSAAGGEGVDDAAAVLHPMNRYLGLLTGLEQEKQQLNADQDVIVALIGGVDSEGLAFYSDVSETNPEFQDSFGIGPGCEAPNPNDPSEPVRGVPPVRLRELVDEFTPGNMFSICESDYSSALEAIAERIRDQIQPSCYTKCVADTDPNTAIVDPECTLEEDPPGNDNQVILPECLRDDQGYVINPSTMDYSMPSDADNACFAMLVDDPSNPLTPSPTDDMSALCLDSAFNIEFVVVRRPGFPAAGGTYVAATCELAEFPDVSCPGIGG